MTQFLPLAKDSDVSFLNYVLLFVYLMQILSLAL